MITINAERIAVATTTVTWEIFKAFEGNSDNGELPGNVAFPDGLLIVGNGAVMLTLFTHSTFVAAPADSS